MWRRLIAIVVFSGLTVVVQASAEPVRGAYPSANVQFLPAFVALEKGFYEAEGLDAGLISVRSAVTAVRGRSLANVQPKRPVRDYMDLRFVNEVVAELEKK